LRFVHSVSVRSNW